MRQNITRSSNSRITTQNTQNTLRIMPVIMHMQTRRTSNSLRRRPRRRQSLVCGGRLFQDTAIMKKHLQAYSVIYSTQNYRRGLYNTITAIKNKPKYRCQSSIGSWLLQSLSTPDVSRWYILLNSTKTEVVIFGIRQRLCCIDCSDTVNVAGGIVCCYLTVKLLGITLDSTLFYKHVSNVAFSCHVQSNRLGLVTRYRYISVVLRIVASTLDYTGIVCYLAPEQS